MWTLLLAMYGCVYGTRCIESTSWYNTLGCKFIAMFSTTQHNTSYYLLRQKDTRCIFVTVNLHRFLVVWLAVKNRDCSLTASGVECRDSYSELVYCIVLWISCHSQSSDMPPLYGLSEYHIFKFFLQFCYGQARLLRPGCEMPANKVLMLTPSIFKFDF